MSDTPQIPLPPKQRKRWRRFISNAVVVILLAFFAFAILASLNTARKPAVYLYPIEDMNVSVSVDVNGFIFNDIPDYNSGWNVFATNDGLIDGEYDYLFYEAALWQVDVPEEGWVVEYGNLENWLDEMLPQLGLNEKESRQFKEYWLAELPESNYYEVRLLTDEYLAENMKLDVSPTPDTVIRLMFHFTPVENQRVLPAPETTTPIRDGFVVVEWGGILAK